MRCHNFLKVILNLLDFCVPQRFFKRNFTARSANIIVSLTLNFIELAGFNLHAGSDKTYHHIRMEIARCLLPDIIAYYESDQGQKEFKEWMTKKEHTERDTVEKNSIPQKKT